MTGSLALAPRRIPLSGSGLIRLLATLGDTDIPTPKDSFSDGLCRWFDWTDAISLSSALDGPQASSTDAPSGRTAAMAAERECRRVRDTVTKLAAPDPTTDDFPPHRQRYLGWQQAMESNIGPLRRKLRASLSAASPALARLAAVDAVMDKVIGARERTLLATVPAWLEQHFERVRGDSSDDQPDRWRETFCQDMREVLLAELDLRMQPVEGLLEALRGSSPDQP
ncbi:DUF3348 domain-containing protein [Rhizobacter sp. P5_C2]